MNRKQHLISTAALALICGSALAIEPDTTDKTVLKGPDVTQTDAAKPQGDHAERPVPFAAWMMAVRAIGRVDPALILTEDQVDQVRAIADAHREEMKAFLKEHQAEVDELRRLAGDQIRRNGPGRHPDSKRPGNAQDEGHRPPPPDDEMAPPPEDEMAPPPRQDDDPSITPEQREEARQKLAALMEKAGEPAAIKQLLAVLTPEQQAAAKKAIEEGRERLAERAEGARNNAEKGDRKGQGPRARIRRADRDGKSDD